METLREILISSDDKLRELSIYVNFSNDITYQQGTDILCSVNSLQRFSAFSIIKDRIKSPADYWNLLKEAYQNSDNLYQHKEEIKKCFSASLPQRSELMNESEQMTFNSLPDEITIYRGMSVLESESKEYGVSWTLDKKTAEFFAFTYQRNYSTNHMEKVVLPKKISKVDAVAFLNDREEQEIIYIGNNLNQPPQLKTAN